MAKRTLENRGPNRAMFAILRDGPGVPGVHVRIALTQARGDDEAQLRPAEVAAALAAAGLPNSAIDAVCDALYVAAIAKAGYV